MSIITAALKIKTELCGYNDVFPVCLQSLSQQFFIASWSVGFRRIEKGYSQVHSVLEQTHRFLFGKKRRITLRQAHAAIANCRNFQIAVAKSSFCIVITSSCSQNQFSGIGVILTDLSLSFGRLV